MLLEFFRDIAARRALSGHLVDLGKPGARAGETLEAIRSRYREALAPDAPVCATYTNEPDDGTGFCDTCGHTRADHKEPIP